MDLEDQLLRDEGCKLTAYQDILGYWTVGVGHKIEVDCGQITQEQANAWLAADIVMASNQLDLQLAWSQQLDEVRRAALINMCFNLGIGSLLQFHHFLGYLQTADWYHAAGEMLNSTWAVQVGDRAKRLAQQVITGVMQ